MIVYNYETDFKLKEEKKLSEWIGLCIKKEGYSIGEINYVFCTDAYLHKLNVEFLKHDTFTDIISFDYTIGKEISGDIFISIERVKENADKYNELFDNEMSRVLIHGILHYLGYKDKTKEEKMQMRAKENECLLLLTH